MGAIRQARIKQERERTRIAEHFENQYKGIIEELRQSNRDHMIERSRLQGELITAHRETLSDTMEQLRTLENTLDRLRTQYRASISELVAIIERSDHDIE